MKKIIILITIVFIASLVIGQTNTDPQSVLVGEAELSFNEAQGVIQGTTDIADVINQWGLEGQIRIYNNTGRTLSDGLVMYITGTHVSPVIGDTVATVDTSSYHSVSIVNRTIGVLTSTVLAGDYGFVTKWGDVNDINTIALTKYGPVYLAGGGTMSMTKPKYPLITLVIGGVNSKHSTNGAIKVDLYRPVPTAITTKSYPLFTTSVDTYYSAGYYEAPAADANLDQGSTTQTYGQTDIAYAAHAFIVAGGAGVSATGVCGLRVTGTSITDAKVLTTSDADTISFDITTLSLNDFVESKKFVGQITYELIHISGAALTTYSLDFNYGWDKYEDYGNQNFTLVGSESIGVGGATDTGFEHIIYHHSDQGWTYSTAAFEPGGTELFSYNSVYGAAYDNVRSGEPIVLKVVPINVVIDGVGSEGIVIKTVTTANNAVKSLVTHLGVVFN